MSFWTLEVKPGPGLGERTWRIGWVYPILLALVIMATIPSCETGQQGPADDPTIVASIYTETQTMIASMQHEVVIMEAKALTTPLTPSEAASLARSKAQLAQIQRLLNQSRSDADAADRQPDAGDMAKGLTSLLPPPFNIPAGIIVGGAAEWFRTRKKRTSFNRLVKALDAVKADSPEFSAAMNLAGPQIKAELGTTARGVVDGMRKT